MINFYTFFYGAKALRGDIVLPSPKGDGNADGVEGFCLGSICRPYCNLEDCSTLVDGNAKDFNAIVSVAVAFRQRVIVWEIKFGFSRMLFK